MGAVKELYINNIPSDESLEEWYQYMVVNNGNK